MVENYRLTRADIVPLQAPRQGGGGGVEMRATIPPFLRGMGQDTDQHHKHPPPERGHNERIWAKVSSRLILEQKLLRASCANTAARKNYFSA